MLDKTKHWPERRIKMKINLRQKSGGANGSSHGRGCCSHATTWVAQKAASDKWRKGHQSNSRGFFCRLCQLISIYFPLCRQLGGSLGSLGRSTADPISEETTLTSSCTEGDCAGGGGSHKDAVVARGFIFGLEMLSSTAGDFI